MSAGAATSAASGGMTAPRVGKFLIAVAVMFAVLKFAMPESLIRPPEWIVLPFADWINAIVIFVREDLNLEKLTRIVAALFEFLSNVTANLLYGKNKWPFVGPIPWTVIAVTAFMAGYALKGWRLGLFSGGTFVWVALLGQWKWTMETLSVIVIAAPFAILFGLLLAIGAWRNQTFEKILGPLLNMAQTLPHFAYMIPVVVFIGVGPKAGAIVTIIFATPPMTRMALLGLKKVPPEVIESGQMCGTTGWQLLRYVRVPTARTEMLIGVNQVIMQSLAMVVLATFIGMPGLGNKLLQLLQGLKIGRSVELGITIVLIAIMLDRCTKAWAQKQPVHFEAGTPWWRRHQNLLIWIGLSLGCFSLAAFWDLALEIKRTQSLSIAKELDSTVGTLVSWLRPLADEIRAFLIIDVLVPLRDAYLWMPFSAVLLLFAGIGWLIGGWRSALVAIAFVGLIALSGWWDRSMITAYTVSFAVFVDILIGFPLGVWASRSERRSQAVLLMCDTLQTFPSFIYLIPVVMLFSVNDVAVVGAVIIVGLVPMTRYTIEGLRGVPPSLIEAADMAGATNWQKLWSVKLPMALPTFMVGINQTVLFCLFMVIIAAFIGTQDLGQELQRALSSTDIGKGLVLGLCVAFMGLLADHLIVRWSKDRKKALGID